MEKNYCKIKITATFTKTLIVATDASDRMLAWKAASFDNRTASESSYNASKELAEKLKELGIETADIAVTGPGLGKEPAIKALIENGIAINMIKDKTPVPHNGIVPIQKVKK